MRRRFAAGFTLTELIITLGIMGTFLGLITMSLVSNQRRDTMQATAETLLSDFRLQQMKAISGNTSGSANPDNYGIYFASNSYTLFRGSSYSANDSSNFTITLDPQFQFSPVGRTVIFQRATGMVNGYSSLQNTISIQDLSISSQKTLQFNQYGVPVSLN